VAKAVRRGDERLKELGSRLADRYADLTVTLDHSSALELLVATILSAQCTDARVNEVTRVLFQRFPGVEEYAGADREELEECVRSTGFFRNKAKHIQQMAASLVADHGGDVPDTMEALVELPGVARKTANVILSNWFGVHEGVVVDTHVKRVAGRLGLTQETDPVKVERDLMELLPRDQWRPFAWRLILHGRSTCAARRPNCSDCELADLCPSAQAFD
jgi:endonuclease-3